METYKRILATIQSLGKYRLIEAETLAEVVAAEVEDILNEQKHALMEAVEDAMLKLKLK